MQLWIYVLHIARPSARIEFSGQEQKVLGKHFEYLRTLVEKDVVVLAGPTETKSYGIVIFRAENEQSAMAIMREDPVVASGVMPAELHPFHASLVHNNIAELCVRAE